MKLFNREALELKLSSDGYVVIPLLEDSDIDELLQFYEKQSFENQLAYTTYASNDIETKLNSNQIIKRIVHSKLEEVVNSNYFPFWGNYMNKNANSQAELPLHNDWQYVDEKIYRSFNVWIPLVDVTIQNGALGVIPNSHLICNFPRGINLPRYYQKNEEQIINKFGKILHLKKGEAVIYDHRLLHYSGKNNSDKRRLAVTLVYIPKDTPVIHFFKDININQTFKYNVFNELAFINSNYFNEPSTFQSKIPIKLDENKEYFIYENLLKNAQKDKLINKLKNYVKTLF